MNSQPTRLPLNEAEFDAALVEYLEQVDRGDTREAHALMSRHPAIAESLKEFIAASQMVEQFVTPLVGQAAQRLGGKETASITSEETWAPLSPLADPFPAFGRYVIKACLGKGAMGAVYLAFDTKLDRQVALKVPLRLAGEDRATVARFYREARSAAKLRHPNICPVFDVGELCGRHFISMAYIEGQELSNLIDPAQPMPLSQIVSITRKLALAIHAAHEKGILHRDLKPSNIMIDANGEPIVMDFGLARQAACDDSSVTNSGALVGSPGYMSPEQIERGTTEIGPRSDMYSLGVILYQMLTGEAPFRGTLISVIPKILYDQPRPPAELRSELRAAPELEKLCLRLLAKRPDERFVSLAEVAEVLDVIEANFKSPGPPPMGESAVEPVPPPLPGEVVPPPLPGEVRPPPAVMEMLPIVSPMPFSTKEHVRAKSIAPVSFSQSRKLQVIVASLLLVISGATLGGIFSGPQALSSLGLPPNPPAKTSHYTAPGKSSEVVKGKQNPAPPTPATVGSEPTPESPISLQSDNKEPQTSPSPINPKTVTPAIELAAAEALTNNQTLNAKMRITTRSASNVPFNVGCVELSFEPGEGPVAYPDQVIQLHSDSGRALYPAFHRDYATAELATPGGNISPAGRNYQLSRLVAYFLIEDSQPLEVTLGIDTQRLVERASIRLNETDDSKALLREWWDCYQQLPETCRTPQACAIKNYLNEMLSRRLQLPAPAVLTEGENDSSLLERAFEQLAGHLLGFESVTVGMATASSEQQRSWAMEPANLPLPPTINLRSVPIDKRQPAGSVEALATHVPAECLYIRCPSVSNYLWFRNVLKDWGGNLEEVVSPRTSHRNIRPRMEKQLAIRADEESATALSSLLSDMALIAFDPYFDEGAAIGVLLQARPETSGALNVWIQQQRAAVRLSDPGSIQEQPIISPTGKRVQLLSSRDGRVRSYYAVDGAFHLITNCERLLERFFEAGLGVANLANLEEYRYARGKFAAHKQDTFLYLSDPFFRNLVSPGYCIEFQRRTRASAEMRKIELARLAARNEQRPCRTLDELVDHGFLPKYYIERKDGLRLSIVGNAVQDLDRGLPGTFRPIADMACSTAASFEINTYQRFAGQIRSEWGLMDPVAVVLNRHPEAGGREQVQVEIKVTPYAKQRYAALRNALAPPSNQRIRHSDDDILSIEATLHGPQVRPFLAYAGLMDTAIDYEVADGTIAIKNAGALGLSYAVGHSYLALNRSDDNARQVLEDLLRSFGFQPSALQRLFGGLFTVPVRIVQWLVGIPVLQHPPTDSAKHFLPTPTPAGNGWGVVSFNTDLAKVAAQRLQTAPSSEGSAQIRFSMGDVMASRVGPYIRAYTYVAARRASAANAHVLEMLMGQLHVAPQDLAGVTQSTLGVELTCPLDGTLQATNVADHGSFVVSNKWPQRSLYEMTAKIPEDYNFAFLSWLRGFRLQFQLDDETLSTKAQFDIQPTKPRPVGTQSL